MVSQQAGTKPSVINTLEGMAGLAGAVKEDIRAARLWGAAEAAREVTGVALPPPSGRCTSPTWLQRVPGWGRRHGKKGWPRDDPCRSK